MPRPSRMKCQHNEEKAYDEVFQEVRYVNCESLAYLSDPNVQQPIGDYAGVAPIDEMQNVNDVMALAEHAEIEPNAIAEDVIVEQPNVEIDHNAIEEEVMVEQAEQPNVEEQQNVPEPQNEQNQNVMKNQNEQNEQNQNERYAG
eukprot:237843_1